MSIKITSNNIEGIGLLLTLIAIFFQIISGNLSTKKEKIEFNSTNKQLTNMSLDNAKVGVDNMYFISKYDMGVQYKAIAEKRVRAEDIFLQNVHIKDKGYITEYFKKLKFLANNVEDIESYNKFQNYYDSNSERYSWDFSINDYPEIVNKINIFNILFYIAYSIGLILLISAKFIKRK